MHRARDSLVTTQRFPTLLQLTVGGRNVFDSVCFHAGGRGAMSATWLGRALGEACVLFVSRRADGAPRRCSIALSQHSHLGLVRAVLLFAARFPRLLAVDEPLVRRVARHVLAPPAPQRVLLVRRAPPVLRSFRRGCVSGSPRRAAATSPSGRPSRARASPPAQVPGSTCVRASGACAREALTGRRRGARATASTHVGHRAREGCGAPTRV